MVSQTGAAAPPGVRSGQALEVDPAMSPTDIMEGWTSDRLAETQAVLERLRTLPRPPS